jgi:hypothetical protein
MAEIAEDITTYHAYVDNLNDLEGTANHELLARIEQIIIAIEQSASTSRSLKTLMGNLLFLRIKVLESCYKASYQPN